MTSPLMARRRCDAITATRRPNDMDDKTFGAAKAKVTPPSAPGALMDSDLPGNIRLSLH